MRGEEWRQTWAEHYVIPMCHSGSIWDELVSMAPCHCLSWKGHSDSWGSFRNTSGRWLTLHMPPARWEDILDPDVSGFHVKVFFSFEQIHSSAKCNFSQPVINSATLIHWDGREHLRKSPAGFSRKKIYKRGEDTIMKFWKEEEGKES